MDKNKKIALLITGVFLFTGIVSLWTGDNQKTEQSRSQEKSEVGKNKSISVFTKHDAQRKIEEYQLTHDWIGSPNVSKGKTIFEFYLIRGEGKGISNLGWFTEKTEEENKYIVGFKEVVGFGDNQLPFAPRWEVTKDSIHALNGKAISITPEFGPQPEEIELTGISDYEKQVYDYLKKLLAEYEDEAYIKYNDEPSSSALEKAENQAVEDTAKKFDITIKEVDDIFNKVTLEKIKALDK